MADMLSAFYAFTGQNDDRKHAETRETLATWKRKKKKHAGLTRNETTLLAQANKANFAATNESSVHESRSRTWEVADLCYLEPMQAALFSNDMERLVSCLRDARDDFDDDDYMDMIALLPQTSGDAPYCDAFKA